VRVDSDTGTDGVPDGGADVRTDGAPDGGADVCADSSDGSAHAVPNVVAHGLANEFSHYLSNC
jgi:hypothetical protein